MILNHVLESKTKEPAAKDLVGVLLVTVSKASWAQVFQEKGIFSPVYLRLNLGRQVTVFKDRKISLSPSQRPNSVQLKHL